MPNESCLHLVRSLPAVGGILFVLTPAAWGAPGDPSTPPYTFVQCYALALRRSDTIASQIELVIQAEEHIREARASFLPSLSMTSNVTRQEAPTNPLLQSILKQTQTTVQGTAKQNLFNGFHDFFLLKQRGLEKDAAAAAREQAKVQLFQDTAQAFYSVLTAERDILDYADEIAADRKRLAELNIRKQVAQARESDLASIESSIANLEASVASTRGLLEAARESLSFLTGLPADSEIRDLEPGLAQAGDVSEWLNQLARRPDIVKARRDVDAAGQSLRAAWGGHAPSVDLLGDYYPARPGLYSSVSWDVQLNVSFPIFSGGLTQALVREAASQKKGREIALDQNLTEGERDVRSAYKTYIADLDQVTKLENATTLAQRYYDLLSKDNRAGNATNVDVLSALATAHNLKRTRDHAQWSAKIDFSRLQALSGGANIPSEPKDGSRTAP